MFSSRGVLTRLGVVTVSFFVFGLGLAKRMWLRARWGGCSWVGSGVGSGWVFTVGGMVGLRVGFRRTMGGFEGGLWLNRTVRSEAATVAP